MPRSQGAVLTTTREGELIRVRPEPPADLWDQLEALNAEASRKEQPRRPADSFTTKEYGEKFNVSDATALRRIRKMIAAGQVQREEHGSKAFYTVVQK